MVSKRLFSFFTVTLSLFVAAAVSRTISPETTLLDAASSLQQTHQILSFDPTQATHSQQVIAAETEPILFNSSSSFSLELHSRETLHRIQHDDYKSLVSARLARDLARVDALTTKLRLFLAGIDRSQLRPVDEEDAAGIRPEDLTTPVISGVSQGSGEYFSRVGLGTPVKELYMVLDTGSDVNWMQCQPCSDCFQQTDPIFDPSSSSSYSPLPCASQQCEALEVSACRANKCLYQVNYGDGSFTVGEFATETVTFGNSGKVNGVALGCGHDNEGLFVGAAGLLGLGGGALSLTSQIKASSFSYCLVDRDSGKSSSLDFNSARPGGGDVTAPLLRNHKIDTFYYVGLTGFSVGGQAVAIPPSLFQVDESGAGGVIVDCGTAVTRLPNQAYNSLRDAFVKLTSHLRSTSGSIALFDTCYDFSSLSTVKVPTVSFQFAGGKTLDLPAKNYLIPVDSAGTFCFGFAPTSSSLSIIGNVQQQGTRVSFDLANNLVGFSPNKC